MIDPPSNFHNVANAMNNEINLSRHELPTFDSTISMSSDTHEKLPESKQTSLTCALDGIFVLNIIVY
jgi:hypothetical protein